MAPPMWNATRVATHRSALVPVSCLEKLGGLLCPCFHAWPVSERLEAKTGHVCDWLHNILPSFFTLVFVNKLSRDECLAYLYITTGLSPTDRLPSRLGQDCNRSHP